METVNFDIEFDSITDTNINPCIEVFLNEKVSFHNYFFFYEKICFPKTEIFSNKKINFSLELQANTNYNLTINRTNHNNKGKQVLIIKKIEADGINLNKILDNVYFYPEYPKQIKEEIKVGKKWYIKQKGWTELGFNGKWVMEFKTPFYTWLLNNT